MFRPSRAAGRGHARGVRGARLRAVRADRAVADGDLGARARAALDTGKLVKQLRDKYGVSITGGQDAVKGKIFRVAHLGYFGPFDILTSVSAHRDGARRISA